MKRKINVFAIIVGSIAIIAFAILIHWNFETEEIRTKGKLIRCPVLSVTYSIKGTDHAKVLVDEKELSALHVDVGLNAGDTIEVRYIEGKSRVVPECVDIWHITYLWRGLVFIPLLLGLPCVIYGIFFPDKITYYEFGKKKKKKKKLTKKK